MRSIPSWAYIALLVGPLALAAPGRRGSDHKDQNQNKSEIVTSIPKNIITGLLVTN